MQEITLFFGKIYTAGTNFTRLLVVTVATNLNSEYQVVEKFLTEELVGETSSSGSNSPLTPLAAPTAFEWARKHKNTQKI